MIDIVGYTYWADTYCPTCVIEKLRTGPGEEFDGWALAEGVNMSTEANLDEVAAAFGIDRYDERSFDSDFFPKVVFRDQLTEDEDGNPEQCGGCGEVLGEI